VVLSTENSSWVDDDDGDQDRETKQPAKTAWGLATNDPKDNLPNLASIFEEETQRAKEAKASQASHKGPGPADRYRPPKGGRPIRNNIQPKDNNNEGQPYPSEPRSPRGEKEKVPVPNEPPFTAFVGNLSFDVTQQDLHDYFVDLGPVQIKLMKDEEGKPKGYAYIEFGTKAGLEKALRANSTEFLGRNLNMDVAKPSRPYQRPTGTGSSHGGYDKERYDTSWGPGPGGRSFNQNRASYPRPNHDNRPPGDRERPPFDRERPPFDRERPPFDRERPKLNINPTQKTPPQSNELVDNMSKPKGSFENPFGSATLNHSKMDELEKQRLKNELEKEKRERERKDEQQQQTQFKNQRKPMSPREMESKTTSSWRTNKPNNNPPPPRTRGDEPAKQKKLIQDEEGFFF